MLPPPAPVVVVVADYGGAVPDYSARVSAYLKRRVSVRIEGECRSACTMVTAVPADRICVGPAASFTFHQAFHPNRFDPLDTTIRAEQGTATLMRFYPKRVRDWIASKGGLSATLITLSGTELAHLFRVCPRGDR